MIEKAPDTTCFKSGDGRFEDQSGLYTRGWKKDRGW